jgi:hypothetical protein
MYLIDKVVRQRAKAGPIGVDNSELINIEIEEEYKQKNQYIEHLMHGKKSGDKSSYIGSSEDKENHHNERLMQRLTDAANIHHDNYDKSKLTSMHSKSHIGATDKSAAAVSHEEWLRRKEHETKLKEQLIREAKKDILDQMRKKRAEEQQRKEEKEMHML